MSNKQQAVFDIHDILKVYYKVAIKRFIDNVVVQVSERYIVEKEGPVKMFLPDLIGGFDNHILTDLAGENFSTASQRNNLVSMAAQLKEALDIAKRTVL